MAKKKKGNKRGYLLEQRFSGWKGGLNTFNEPSEIDADEFSEGVNIMYEGEGSLTKRYGISNYDTENDSRVRGGYNYRMDDGSSVLLRMSDVSLQYTSEDTAPTDLTGKSFTAGKDTFFTQLREKVYAANGTDTLAYTDDGTTLTGFTALATPTWAGTPLTAGAGLSTGTHTVSYRVAAVNDVGETLANTASTITVDIHPDSWDEADEYMRLTWVRITTSGIVGYNIYGRYDSAINGIGETFLGFVAQPTSGTNVTWDDTGSDDYAASTMKVPQLANTTGGQVFDVIFAQDGRLYGVDWDTNPSQLWFSAGGELPNSFLVTDGGGWILYSGGDGDKVVAVTNVGENIIVAKQYRVGKLSISSVAGIAVPSIANINETTGFAGPRAYTIANNDIVYVSPDKRVRVLGYQENYTADALRTSEFGQMLRPTLDQINSTYLDRISCFFYKGIFGVSYARGGAVVNDRTLCFDLERGSGAYEWDIGAYCFFEYIDTTGGEHLMACSESDGYMQEWFKDSKTDKGVAFTSRVVFRQETMDLPYEHKIYQEVPFRLRDVSGTTKLKLYLDNELSATITAAITTTRNVGGFGSSAYSFGSMQFGTYGSLSSSLTEERTIEKIVEAGYEEGRFMAVGFEHTSTGDFTLIDYGVRAERISADYNPSEYIWN